MADQPLVIVYPPTRSGARRVRARGELLGLAQSVHDVAEFLRRSGLDEVDEVDELTVETTGMIEWRGGGPDAWPEPPA